MAAQSKNAGRGSTAPGQSFLLPLLLHLDSLTHLQPSLALLKFIPSSNVLSLKRKEDLLSPGPDCGGIQSSGDGIEMLLDGLVRHDGSFEMIVNNVVIERCELKIVNGDCDG